MKSTFDYDMDKQYWFGMATLKGKTTLKHVVTIPRTCLDQ